MGCKEGEIKVRSLPLAEERRKNSSLHDFDGPVSNLQGTNTKKDTEQCSRSTFSVSDRRQSFWTLSRSFLVWLEKQVTHFQRTLRSKWLKLPDCYNCRRKNVLKLGADFPHEKDRKVGTILKTLWYFLKRNLYGHPLASLLWERTFENVLFEWGIGKIHGNVFTCTEGTDYSYRFMCMI